MTEQKQLLYPTERRIKLALHFGQFLQEIGYTRGHKEKDATGERIRKQLLHLLKHQAHNIGSSRATP